MKAVGLTSGKGVKTLENIGYSVLHLQPSVCVDIHEESRLFVRFVSSFLRGLKYINGLRT